MDTPALAPVTSYGALQKLIVTELEAVVRALGVTEEAWKNGPFAFLIQAPKAPGFDACFLCYNFAKQLKKNPKDTSTLVYNALVEKKFPFFSKIENGNGFIHYNICVSMLASAAFGEYMVPRVDKKEKSGPMCIEFSSPNTNKPQHLGHVRNNCLGTAISLLLSHQGYDVTKIILVNDRGIHICKSMLAYQKLGNGLSKII
jgi:arginyl-tRNA synthetase